MIDGDGDGGGGGGGVVTVRQPPRETLTLPVYSVFYFIFGTVQAHTTFCAALGR